MSKAKSLLIAVEGSIENGDAEVKSLPKSALLPSQVDTKTLDKLIVNASILVVIKLLMLRCVGTFVAELEAISASLIHPSIEILPSFKLPKVSVLTVVALIVPPSTLSPLIWSSARVKVPDETFSVLPDPTVMSEVAIVAP